MRNRTIQTDLLNYLQDFKVHKTRDICIDLSISRSTCIRHINDLSIYYDIRTIVGLNGGIQLINNKNIIVDFLTNDELQLIINHLGLLQNSSKNILRLVANISLVLKNRKDI